MKISVGFICPEPEAAKSPVLVDRQTHAHPNTASRRSLWWLTHSLALTTPTTCTQLIDRVATCHFPLYTCGMYNISEQCLYNMAYMFSFFSSLDTMNKWQDKTSLPIFLNLQYYDQIFQWNLATLHSSRKLFVITLPYPVGFLKPTFLGLLYICPK